MATEQGICIGDRVSFDWGFHRATGRVVDIYGPKGRRFAIVELARPEDIDGEVVNLPIDELQPLARA